MNKYECIIEYVLYECMIELVEYPPDMIPIFVTDPLFILGLSHIWYTAEKGDVKHYRVNMVFLEFVSN